MGGGRKVLVRDLANLLRRGTENCAALTSLGRGGGLRPHSAGRGFEASSFIPGGSSMPGILPITKGKRWVYGDEKGKTKTYMGEACERRLRGQAGSIIITVRGHGLVDRGGASSSLTNGVESGLAEATASRILRLRGSSRGEFRKPPLIRRS